MDCTNVAAVLRNNPLITKFIAFFTSFIVVEFDLPWDDSQVAEYGPEFKAWVKRNSQKL